MLETFINLASVVSEGATITEASLHAPDLISIDGVTKGGDGFRLTYRLVKEQEDADS